jgi:hypothetical protein
MAVVRSRLARGVGKKPLKGGRHPATRDVGRITIHDEARRCPAPYAPIPSSFSIRHHRAILRAVAVHTAEEVSDETLLDPVLCVASPGHAQWAAPVNAMSINTWGSDGSQALTFIGRKLYLSSSKSGHYELHYATRTAPYTYTAFGAPTHIPELADPDSTSR